MVLLRAFSGRMGARPYTQQRRQVASYYDDRRWELHGNVCAAKKRSVNTAELSFIPRSRNHEPCLVR